MTEPLKPCPFCGGEPRLYGGMYGCAPCGAKFFAAEDWNRRAPSPARLTQEQREDLEYALECINPDAGSRQYHAYHTIRTLALLSESTEENPAKAAPICIGYQTLQILAREGAVFNLVAADDLYGTVPVAQGSRPAKAKLLEVAEEMDRLYREWGAATAAPRVWAATLREIADQI